MIDTSCKVPYRNQALEEYLLDQVDSKSLILYLWQNQRTVVIGKNQDAFNECNIERLENDGGYLARRLSGGGAVYHDLGNLNFTFLSHKVNYDVDRQDKVILDAMNRLGFDAEKNGRNDLLIDGRKFSGHAYYSRGDRC
ncbi:MAG: lipoate--protein ligase, partial [Erysipelotrichaceae bacterium]|nr:lipoate--protein ligase [Erysipelotrichaceae bacterium]